MSDTYHAVHQRLLAQRGPARNHVCIVAGCERQADAWAWDHTGPSLIGLHRGVAVTWGTDLSTYWPMCHTHHAMMDRGGTLTHCPNGHSREEAGVSLNGACAECHRERRLAWYHRNAEVVNRRKREARA